METPKVTRPLLIFDGDCGFCRRWIKKWQSSIGPQIDFAPFQELQISNLSLYKRSIVFVEPPDQVTVGAEAVFRALSYGPQKNLLQKYRRSWAFRFASEGVYKFIARHRMLASKVERFFSRIR